VSRLHLEHAVKLCGNLQHQECLEVMSRSAVFVRPTLYDGDALSVREAQALGVRVVASATDFRPSGVLLYRSDVPGDIVAKALQALQSEGATPRPYGNDFRNLEQVRQVYVDVMTD
jgi:glycosyltransferase involved in cell wall biosynthesis